MIWIRPNGKLPWRLQRYFWYEKFMPREAAYMVKNWSFISALLSGNRSQFSFETLIATETNYEWQDLKPPIQRCSAVLGATLGCSVRDLSKMDFLSQVTTHAKQDGENYLEGQWKTLGGV